jgi:hypothetical protein
VADAPWRCSQCGTVNEPVANACRTCGRWPSLSDLEQSTVEAEVPDAVEDDPYAAQSVDVDEVEPEAFEVVPPPAPSATDVQPEYDYGDEAEGPEVPKPTWQRFARLIVPIGVVLYILISSLANR